MRDSYTKPENLGLSYQPISMPNNITRHILGILRTQSSFYDEVLSQKQLTATKSLTNFAENAPSQKFQLIVNTS